ncbi:phosphatidylinositol N-acetylglucosaminyltransferase subunit P-like [Oppia nitens]|uniref:phosphatidylinositol N-acetylglucosaminyltransferase subunit P-like n=1 Tax=Oppia nitens TaxID=1686743 RepID=UPI0023DAAD59|nr:phosphatidylinositol N-acetylglucosaminyltransferase subunit P-like [Oppia nitens]
MSDWLPTSDTSSGHPNGQNGDSRSPNPSPNTGRCIYGFVLFLVSILMFLLYFLYAIITTQVFQSIGLTYFERKYWSLAIPTQILVSIVMFAVCLYPSVNYLFTPSLNHCNTLFDSNTRNTSSMKTSSMDTMETKEEKSHRKAIPPIQDLKPDFVSQQLYLN